jgi:hypothetical protein
MKPFKIVEFSQLHFTIPPAFKLRYKTFAYKHGISCKELLYRGFELVRREVEEKCTLGCEKDVENKLDNPVDTSANT